MVNEFSDESLKEAKENAKWAYDKSREKFSYVMLELVFLKIKSLLTEQGYKKVAKMDERRKNNENFGVEFSQKTWEALAEAWMPAENQALAKIATLYNLEPSDLDISTISVDIDDDHIKDLDGLKC